MIDWKSNATRAADILRNNACLDGVIGLFVLASAPVIVGAHGFTSPLGWWLLLALAVLVLAFSAHLLFDAALFRLAASHTDEMTGLGAIDDVLARMGLRRRDSGVRPLPARISGARRILWSQRIGLLVCLLLYAILFIDSTNGPILC